MNVENIMAIERSHSNTINESELIRKYKSSYKSAFIDFSIHTLMFSSALYLVWLFKNSLLSVFTIPLMVFMTNRTFIVFHDCCHQSYTPNKTLNYIISHITGMFVLTSPNWMLDHRMHHSANGNIENEQYQFNETIRLTKKQFLLKTKTQQILYVAYQNPFVFFLMVPISYFVVLQQVKYTIIKCMYTHVFQQSLLQIAIDHFVNNILSLLYLSKIYECGLLKHFIIWFSMSVSIEFVLFHNEHTFDPSYVVKNKEWTQRNSGLLGSSFIQIPKCLKYFYMGVEYHHIHHMNTKIPGYNLQKYHEEVVFKSNLFDNIVKLSIGDCYKNLWLVLYDEDNHKYITFEEVYEETQNKKNIQ